MIASGPFVLEANTLFNTTDPTWTQPCAVRVQIQNSSGFLVLASIGGVQYLIQPFTASTVPTKKTPYLTISPGNPQSSYGALISFSWLQPGEDPPMADGTLTPGVTQSVGALSFSATSNFNGLGVIGFGPLGLPNPPLGFVYALFSMTLSPASAAPNVFNLVDFVITDSEGHVFENPDVGTASGSSVTLPLGALLQYVAPLIKLTATPAADASGIACTFTLLYDLFPQPIG